MSVATFVSIKTRDAWLVQAIMGKWRVPGLMCQGVLKDLRDKVVPNCHIQFYVSESGIPEGTKSCSESQTAWKDRRSGRLDAFHTASSSSLWDYTRKGWKRVWNLARSGKCVAWVSCTVAASRWARHTHPRWTFATYK